MYNNNNTPIHKLVPSGIIGNHTGSQKRNPTARSSFTATAAVNNNNNSNSNIRKGIMRKSFSNTTDVTTTMFTKDTRRVSIGEPVILNNSADSSDSNNSSYNNRYNYSFTSEEEEDDIINFSMGGTTIQQRSDSSRLGTHIDINQQLALSSNNNNAWPTPQPNPPKPQQIPSRQSLTSSISSLPLTSPRHHQQQQPPVLADGTTCEYGHVPYNADYEDLDDDNDEDEYKTFDIDSALDVSAQDSADVDEILFNNTSITSLPIQVALLSQALEKSNNNAKAAQAELREAIKSEAQTRKYYKRLLSNMKRQHSTDVTMMRAEMSAMQRENEKLKSDLERAQKEIKRLQEAHQQLLEESSVLNLSLNNVAVIEQAKNEKIRAVIQNFAIEAAEQLLELKSSLKSLRNEVKSELPRVIVQVLGGKNNMVGSPQAIARLSQQHISARIGSILSQVNAKSEAALNSLLNDRREAGCELKLEEELKLLKQQLLIAQERYVKEANLRRELHNALIEERGNIRVHCRVRPFVTREEQEQEEMFFGSPITILDDESMSVVGSNGKPRQFQFDKIYGMQAQQADVFADVKPLLTSVLDGYNVCILAYGQTGSGKTYTMQGSPENPGIIIRSLSTIFNLMASRSDLYDFSLKLNMVEIYNNNIRDLLASQSVSAAQPSSSLSGGIPTSSSRRSSLGSSGSPASSSLSSPWSSSLPPTGATEKNPASEKKGLSVYDLGSKGLEINNLTTHVVKTVDDVKRLIRIGISHRTEAATLMNEHSSRSHSIVTLEVESTLREGVDIASQPGIHKGCKARLRFVDLAGSENVSKSGVSGEALHEASCVNKSLSALGDVLTGLSQQKSHIPYRNSRLTHLLQDSLGGNAKMLLFVNVSPSRSNLTESVHALSFGARARQVRRGAAQRNVVSTDSSNKSNKTGSSNNNNNNSHSNNYGSSNETATMSSNTSFSSSLY